MSWGIRGWPVTGRLLGRLKIDGGIVSRALPVLDLKQTWADVQRTFTGLALNITDNGSSGFSSPLSVGSAAVDVRLGASTRLQLHKQGMTLTDLTSNSTSGFGYGFCRIGNPALHGLYTNYAASSASIQLFAMNQPYMALAGGTVRVNAAYPLGWSSGAADNTLFDAGWARDATGTINQRNGTNGQIGRWSRTHTDSSNYERVELDCSTNTFILRPAALGTGTLRPLYLRTATTTVAGLAAAATVGAGTICHVTDANATTIRSVVAGGGSNFCQVISDGTNWLIAA